MGEFVIKHIEIIAAATGVLTVGAIGYFKFKKPSKNFFDVSDLTRQYKKRQQALNPKNKLF